MICVTGDMHGDYSRFNDKKIKKLKKGDFLIVCGDFGFVWNGSKKEKRILKRIGRKRFYTMFVEGCHENYDLLDSYPEEEMFGGKVNVISGRLMHMKRGNMFTLQGHKFFAFGGGQTKEIDIRREFQTWWEQELPTPEEVKHGITVMQENNNEADYIITHEPPASMKEFLSFEVRQISHMHTFLTRSKMTASSKCGFSEKCIKTNLSPQGINAFSMKLCRYKAPNLRKKAENKFFKRRDIYAAYFGKNA